jgi:hypothetical protein
MKKFAVIFLVILNLSVLTLPAFSLTDEEVKQKIIDDSIKSYSGKCPCPYSKMKSGRKCGIRSAYKKPNGEKPICFSSDITQEMIDRYRSKFGDRE